MNADGTGLRRLTRDAEAVAGVFVSEERPAWSPGGSTIALDRRFIFDMSDCCSLGVVVVDVATGAEQEVGRRRLDPCWSAQNPYATGHPWSPDGRSLLLRIHPGGRLVTVDLDTGRESELPWAAASASSWQRIATD